VTEGLGLHQKRASKSAPTITAGAGPAAFLPLNVIRIRPDSVTGKTVPQQWGKFPAERVVLGSNSYRQ
jgi:hypothetical protein